MEALIIIHGLNPLDELRVVVVLEEESLPTRERALHVLHEQFKRPVVLFYQRLQYLLHDLVVLCMSTPPPLGLLDGCARARAVAVQRRFKVGRVRIDELRELRLLPKRLPRGHRQR